MDRLFPVNRVKGFTLLELLVALVLIGIILSFATLSFDTGEDRKIKEEASRLFSLIKLAQEESILNDRNMVFNINAKGYQFVYLKLNDKNKYEEHALADPVFRAREFAEYVHPVINIEKSRFDLKTAEQQNQQAVIKIYILSSGEITPFQIELPAADIKYKITSSIQGVVELNTLQQDS